MTRRTTAALADYLSRYGRVVEVGIGRRTDVAATLVDRGTEVTATDVHPRPVPDGVRFVRDDIVVRAERDAPPGPPYAVDAVYALNLPPELHRPTRDVAHAAGADFLFTTLGGDPPTVPVERVTLDTEAGVETLYVSRHDGSKTVR
ncbi:hypothetical protein C2R22_01925 [Salinigranum rubrum]|uniref:UPF0146 protein C2R22_01925 n=1 Tax=Salinigranum rubrum TaxID=755307 RepID=A0A2I8VF66_9EURY|nr:UPF0146 family protein [Salinigranum rubrum]AUV80572.1 hypothetical protein C2R22_01925 [Salinigranum rubrum]